MRLKMALMFMCTNLEETWQEHGQKFDLVSVKLTEKDSDFFSNFPSILNNPKMYTKAKSNAFLAPVPPYQDNHLCDVMLALQNDSEMRFMKSLCDTFKVWLQNICSVLGWKAMTMILMMTWMLYIWRCHLKTNKCNKYMLLLVHSKYMYHFSQLTWQTALLLCRCRCL